MIPPVFQIIAASAECRTLLGTNPVRCYLFGEAPQGTPPTYAVYQMVTSVPANYLGQLPDVDDARIQVDVYATSQSVVRETAKAIRDAIEPYAHMLNAADRGRDAQTRNYGFMLEFEFFTDR